MRRGIVVAMVVGGLVAAVLGIACGDASSADSLGGRQNAPGSAESVNPPGVDAGGFVDDGGGVNEGLNTTGVGAGTGANTGLPCDVQQLLENRCIGCHVGPSPVALLTYADLMKPSPTNATKTLAQTSLDRMKSAASPMPPPPAVPPTATEVSTFAAWVNAGAPQGAACTTPGDAGVDAGSIYNTKTVCTSNQTWTGGNRESPAMRPGGACITCHTIRGGPAYTIAGTVYPTAHEPNDCNGVNSKLTVVVTDKNGTVTNIPVNSVGNFYSQANVVAPFQVQVTDGSKTRAMTGTLTAGDCNSCHTPTGANNAPGRIMAP